MPTHQKVYARSITRRLKREVKGCPKQVLFLSPYLTSHTAETVISEANSKDSEIYTTFSAENFAVGASSLRTVRRLLESGFDVYHLPELHAKIVLTKKFASVGSQNLTAGGTRNREVSVALSDEREIKYLRSEISEWFGDRKLITLKMVEDMEVLLPSLRKKHRDFKKAIDATDEEITAQEINRKKGKQLQQAKRQREADRKLRERLRQQSQSLRAAVQSKEVIASESISTRLVIKDNYDEYGSYQGDYSTLERRRHDVSLLDWSIAEEGRPVKRHQLEKRDRYLIMLLDNGRLAWTALNKTQITHFGTGLDVTETQSIGDYRYKFYYELASNEEDLLTWNVEVKIGPISDYHFVRNSRIVVRGYFSLTDLSIVSLSYEPDTAVELPEVMELRSRLDGDDLEIRDLIKDGLLKPFRYKTNRYGVKAGQFFRGQGNHFDLKLRELDDFVFLTAEKTF